MLKSSKASPDELERVPLRRNLLFLAIASIGCYTDLWTKSWAFSSIPLHETYWVIPNYFGFQTTENTGALFGQLPGKVHYLAIFSVIALVGIIFWFVWGKIGRDLPMTWTLGLITGGILGNMYDRFGLWSPDGKQAVRDWILFQYSEDLQWPNFNIADSLLVCGAAWLFILSFRKPPE